MVGYHHHHQPNLQQIALVRVCNGSAPESAYERRAPRCMCVCALDIKRGYVCVWLSSALSSRQLLVYVCIYMQL